MPPAKTVEHVVTRPNKPYRRDGGAKQADEERYLIVDFGIEPEMHDVRCDHVENGGRRNAEKAGNREGA